MPFTSTMKIGVLDDTQLLTYDYKSKEYEHVYMTFRIESLSELLALAHTCHVHSLWITPGSHLSHAGRHMIDHLDRDAFAFYVSKSRFDPRFILIWRREGIPSDRPLSERTSVKMAWPEWDSRWPWAGCQDAQTLLRSILYLQDALECEIAWSPGHVGQELMLAHIKHEDWLAPCEIPPVITKNLAKDMTYKRPLTDEEKRMGMYLHLFDGNSKYLAACTSANLGEGNPKHLEGDIEFKALFPGVWRAGNTWKWTPEWEYIFTAVPDVRPIVEEAWAWPRYHQALRPWAEHMWDARERLHHPWDNVGPITPYTDKEACKLAYEAVKPIYTQGMGWLAMESKQGDNKLCRPDWWSQIVAGVYRAMGFKIRQLRSHDMSVCYANVDTLGLVSYGESIEKYETLLLNRQDRLGGFKYVGSIAITQDLIALFDDGVPFKKCQMAIVNAIEEGHHAKTA